MTARRDKARDALAHRLGHEFSDIDLFDRALTHISALSGENARAGSYQRLEFLGDRVLGLAVAEMLVAAFPDAEEGELSRRLAELVRAEACADVALAMDIGPAIRLGQGEAHSGGRRKKAILADVCEAVVGAVFIDGGFDAARGVVDRFWRERMLNPRRPLRDGKTALQEWAQGQGLPPPLYQEVGRAGPDHNPVFRIEVVVDGHASVLGEGRSKRAAEQDAAVRFLTEAGVWEGAENV